MGSKGWAEALPVSGALGAWPKPCQEHPRGWAEACLAYKGWAEALPLLGPSGRLGRCPASPGASQGLGRSPALPGFQGLGRSPVSFAGHPGSWAGALPLLEHPRGWAEALPCLGSKGWAEALSLLWGVQEAGPEPCLSWNIPGAGPKPCPVSASFGTSRKLGRSPAYPEASQGWAAEALPRLGYKDWTEALSLLEQQWD